MNAQLTLKDGTTFEGSSFGYDKSTTGEVVFATGMVGYPESLTDPSFKGQILVMSYPLLGNYGVPKKSEWESGKIQVSGLIVSSYIDTPSHHASEKTLSQWLKEQKIPALEIKDTRALVQKLRMKGAMLGRIDFNSPQPPLLKRGGVRGSSPLQKGRLGGVSFEDPNLRNLVAEVSTKKVLKYGSGKKTICLIDCGAKQNIVRDLVKRNVKVLVVPWDYDLSKVKYDGLLISNGPGDPKKAVETIANVKKALSGKKPILGICLGNQILALAAGGDTYKLKFGHRGQNQPCKLVGSKRAYLTTQNHGFAVGKIPKGFKEWFKNANDGTNEGIIHTKKPFMSVQFHPESAPGPLDTAWIFDEFIKTLK